MPHDAADGLDDFVRFVLGDIVSARHLAQRGTRVQMGEVPRLALSNLAMAVPDVSGAVRIAIGSPARGGGAASTSCPDSFSA